MFNKSRRSKFAFKILIAGFLIFLLFFFLFFKSGLFNVSYVEIITHNPVCVSQNQIDSSQILGRNFFLIDTKKFEKSIKEKFICVKEITISPVLPNKIKVKIFGREGRAKLIAQRSEASSSSELENIATPSADWSSDGYLMDAEGIIFSKDNSGLNLPNIFISGQSLFEGKKLIDNNAQNSLKILEKLNLFGLDVKFTLILDNNFIVFSRPKIIFKLDDKVDTQIASLQLIMQKAKIDASQLEFIDLRFDKPAIKIAPKKNG